MYKHKIQLLMKENMGKIDRILRIMLAVVIAVLFFTHLISGTLGIILLVLAGILLFTSLIGSCPLYIPFGIKTKKE